MSSRTKNSAARIRKLRETSEVARADRNGSQVLKLRSIPADGWKPGLKKVARDKVARNKAARTKIARNKVARTHAANVEQPA